jgi:hypothetical protein
MTVGKSKIYHQHKLGFPLKRNISPKKKEMVKRNSETKVYFAIILANQIVISIPLSLTWKPSLV